MMDPVGLRAGRIIARCIAEFDLRLDGLNILTEAATGPYLYTPIMAAAAGAERVFAVAADSCYGSREAVAQQTIETAARFGVADRVQVVFEKTPQVIGVCDIITNSGFVRPITRAMIECMKATAVLPLMWETWEFRREDLDLEACREHGILVLGTDESRSPLEMYPCSGFLGMKLLFELGLEGYKTKVLLLGGGAGLAGSIEQHFRAVGVDLVRFGEDSSSGLRCYDDLNSFFSAHGGQFDALIVAEHESKRRLLGDGGLLPFAEIVDVNPALRIGIIAGGVDTKGLRCSPLLYFPETIRPLGYMSYQPFDLGPFPVLELYAAGLKVGEAMARARLGGLGVHEAELRALETSPAMSFPGGR